MYIYLTIKSMVNNDSDKACFVYRKLLKVLSNFVRDYTRDNFICEACEIEDGSQLHHNCLMLTEAEKVKRTFLQAIRHVNEEEVLDLWHEQLLNPNNGPVIDLLYMPAGWNTDRTFLTAIRNMTTQRCQREQDL